jgi:hypothetical protein
MPKFYVKSGNLRYIIDKEDHQSAITSALIYAKEKGIMTGLRVCYSEQGFVSFKEWVCDDIENYLKEI